MREPGYRFWIYKVSVTELGGRDEPKSKWEFPKIRGTLFWGPYHKDLTI